MLATLGNFFGPDTLIIFLVIVLLFGAKKFPELARCMTFDRMDIRKLPKADRLELFACVLLALAIAFWIIRFIQ